MENPAVANIEIVIEYIENHLNDKLTLETVAEAVHFSKYHLHKNHVAQGAADDADQGVPFPDIQAANHARGNQLREKTGQICKTHSSQAVDDQHTHNRVGEKPAQFFYQFWGGSAVFENKKGKEPDCGGDCCDDCYSKPIILLKHGFPPFYTGKVPA